MENEAVSHNLHRHISSTERTLPGASSSRARSRARRAHARRVQHLNSAHQRRPHTVGGPPALLDCRASGAAQGKNADSPAMHPRRRDATRPQHSQPAQSCGLYVIRPFGPAAYSHSSAGRPRCVRMAPRHRGRTARPILAGGAKRPPETPLPPLPRGPARHRQHAATPAAPPAPRSPKTLAQARQGRAAGRRGLRAWLRSRAGAVPACGGWPLAPASVRPVSAPGGAGPALASLARPQSVVACFGARPVPIAARAPDSRHRAPLRLRPLAGAGAQGCPPWTRPGTRPWTRPSRAKGRAARTDAPRRPNGRRG